MARPAAHPSLGHPAGGSGDPAYSRGHRRLGAVFPSAQTYCESIRKIGAAVPWELWGPPYLYDLEEVPGGVPSRTSRGAVCEDAAYGATHDASATWKALCMPALLVRAGRLLLPGGGFIVGAQLRDAFLAAVPSARAVDVDANHYRVMADPGALGAIEEFLGAGR